MATDLSAQEQAEIELAIRLSLGQPGPQEQHAVTASSSSKGKGKQRPTTTITIDSSSEEEAEAEAEAGLMDSTRGRTDARRAKGGQSKPPAAAAPPPPPPNSHPIPASSPGKGKAVVNKHVVHPLPLAETDDSATEESEGERQGDDDDDEIEIIQNGSARLNTTPTAGANPSTSASASASGTAPRPSNTVNKRKQVEIVTDSDTDSDSTSSSSSSAQQVATIRSTKRRAGGRTGDATSVVASPASKRTKMNDDTGAQVQATSSSSSLHLSYKPGTDEGQPSSSSAITPWGNISRAEMEKERLARIAARERAGGGDTSTTEGSSTDTRKPVPSYAPYASSSLSSSSTSSRRTSNITTLASLGRTSEEDDTSVPPSHASSSSRGIASLASLASQNSQRRYWQGICRPTASIRHPGTEGFAFKDVVGDTDGLQSALLVTFQGEQEWIHSHFPDRVNVALVMPHPDIPPGQCVQAKTNMRMYHPQKSKARWGGCMHIKLILLYYKTFLRVAVATANLVEYDWEIIENAVYVHDFPRIKAPYSKPSNFLDTLLRTHTSLGTPSGLYKEALTYFDYSSAEGVRLVLSVPGYQRGARDLGQNGHTGLSKALQELNLATLPDRARLDLECQHSSCGAYTMDWIRSFYRSAMGWDPINAGISSGTSRKKLPVPDKHWPPLKIVYPTLRTVKESLGGVNGGGTIFCNLETWRRPSHPRQLYYDSVSRRRGLLQHTKMLLGLVTPTPLTDSKGHQSSSKQPISAAEQTPDFEPFAWLYVGSHNLSLAAWGRYSNDKGSLDVANHELGVVLPIRGKDLEGQINRMITWQRPVARYRPDDEPWDQRLYLK